MRNFLKILELVELTNKLYSNEQIRKLKSWKEFDVTL